MTDFFNTDHAQYSNCIGDIDGDGSMDLMIQKTDSDGWHGFLSFSNGAY